MKTLLILFVCSSLTIRAYAQSNTADSAATVVKNFLDAYRSGDHDRLIGLLHPEVIWIQPGYNRVSGTKKSREELLQMGARMAEISAHTLKLTSVETYAAEGNTVVCILHWEAVQPTGNKLNVDNIDVYTVEQGRIAMVRVFSENIEMENKFWGQ